MNKLLFKLVVFLMTIALIGIIVVQVYLINTSFKNNEEQFKSQVKQVLNTVSKQIHDAETFEFLSQYNKFKDSLGKPPKQNELRSFFYVEKNKETNQTIIYSNSIVAEDYTINRNFFDKSNDTSQIQNYVSKRVTEVIDENIISDINLNNSIKPISKKEISGTVDAFERVQYEVYLKDIAGSRPLNERVNLYQLQTFLKKELAVFEINIPFETAIYSNGLATKVKSEKFKFNKVNTFDIPLFIDNNGKQEYELLVSFPQKKLYLITDLVGIALLAFLFTTIITVAFYVALNQLNKQRQISEIKTDFINNMTHEFKTPIATINLALDAIKNPKIIDNKEMVFKYLQMIKEENKRMHAQVENVLRISKLEKRELDINKEIYNINEVIEDAIEHVSLIIEDRNGILNKNFLATKTSVLLNEVHFTNVLVNVLENAIKYSPEQPVISVSTENIKNFVLIKISDKGQGISKNAQKKIFDKFYREHTGDIHNVKGHGLGLSYVKRIVEDHNGMITVESEKGKGSTFIIKTPIIY